ncbi:hypothetical protein [Salininema proteolyticum]|uniref:Uncharacterized protein n=1 Tax=Salininema proteolyticum TaxID=1607685 RepID=A0ABV8TWZ4_9ACTN
MSPQSTALNVTEGFLLVSFGIVAFAALAALITYVVWTFVNRRSPKADRPPSIPRPGSEGQEAPADRTADEGAEKRSE